MKNNNHSQKKFTKDWYDSFDDREDTRYYGVFLKGTGANQYYHIDPVRYKEIFGIPDDMEKAMSKKKGRFFRPARKRMSDYSVNILLGKLSEIKQDWYREQKPFINRFLSEIKGVNLTINDDDLYHLGIVDGNEAAERMQRATRFSHEYAEFKKNNLRISLYAQYFHQLAARVDAALIQILAHNGYEGEEFTLDTFLAFKGANEKAVKSLKGYNEFKKLRLIWNFIKHNNLSSYNKLKSSFPENLKTNVIHEYDQGELGCFYVVIDDDLIDSLLIGIERFFIEYCRLCLGEDAKEAAWNSEEYFFAITQAEIDSRKDPFGFRFEI